MRRNYGNMNCELISIIIPIYNVEEYLCDSIESVLKQTYTNIELILINDGSTDKSLDICKKYAKKDERIKIINQKNHGIAYTRNVGLWNAEGNYIMWVDSDDYIKEDVVEILYNEMRKYDADITICDFMKGSDRNYIFPRKETNDQLVFNHKQGLEYIYANDHFSFVMTASWGKLIKKHLYEGLVYPEGKLFEDVYMSHYLIHRCKKIVFVNQIMYYYFQWSESILGNNFNIKKLDYLEWFKSRINFFNEYNYLNLKEKARLQYLHALMWEYSRAKDILHNKEIARKIVKEYRLYYTLGTYNPLFEHETKWYMLKFFLSPLLTDFLEKIKGKLGV